MNGRKPKLDRAAADRLLFLYTIGTPVRDLARMYKIDPKAVRNYINGTHKNPALRWDRE